MIRLLLNRREIASDLPATLPTLDFLRLNQGLTGAKAGCREGDCGACGVLVGERLGGGGLRYRAMNSCILPLGALAGRHLLTIECLGGDALSPVQTALAEEGGGQCGFCSPGLVIALTNWLLNGRSFDAEEALEALDGNFCRCTGYQGIKRAAARLAALGRTLAEDGDRIPALVAAGVLPPWLPEIPARLAPLAQLAQTALPPLGALLMAGGTDLFAHPRRPSPLSSLWLAGPGLKGIRLEGGRCRIGAATTLEELLESALLAAHLPHFHALLSRVGATPIRDRATLGGNLVNASPIGDLSICLLALGAEVRLHGPAGERRLPLGDFFLGYKRLDKTPEELVTAVEFPLHDATSRFHFEKVAHREHLDIAAVNSALCLELDGDHIRHAALAAGGVAPIPLLLRQTSALLIGRRIGADLVRAAAERAMSEVAPIDDVRGSAAYKRRLLGRLVFAHFLALAPEALLAGFPQEDA
jgi:xanthine dehydrogenase small subunit